MTVLRNTIAVAAALFAVNALAQNTIVNSAHDLSPASTAAVRDQTAGGQLCIFCHTPHGGNQAVAPLWNRTATASTFTLYNSPTMNAVTAQPSGISRACMSCHDGTVAFASLLNPQAGHTYNMTFANMAARGGVAYLGTDLSNDHPVAFTYNAALATADGELYNPTTTNSGLGGTIAANMLFGAGNDQMECASCHDVHRPGTGTDRYPFLRKGNTQSALCLTCHIK